MMLAFDFAFNFFLISLLAKGLETDPLQIDAEMQLIKKRWWAPHQPV
jgi:hypothetical protein